MKEHIEYNTAEDIDGLVDRIAALNQRLARLYDEILSSPDHDMIETLKRSRSRLLNKRHGLLVALRQALKYI